MHELRYDLQVLAEAFREKESEADLAQQQQAAMKQQLEEVQGMEAARIQELLSAQNKMTQVQVGEQWGLLWLSCGYSTIFDSVQFIVVQTFINCNRYVIPGIHDRAQAVGSGH